MAPRRCTWLGGRAEQNPEKPREKRLGSLRRKIRQSGEEQTGGEQNVQRTSNVSDNTLEKLSALQLTDRRPLTK